MGRGVGVSLVACDLLSSVARRRWLQHVVTTRVVCAASCAPQGDARACGYGCPPGSLLAKRPQRLVKL
eukprot:6984512-Prymnesium_polylepis.2